MKATITDKDGALKVSEQLCFALYSTSRAFTKQYANFLAGMNITYPQYIALMVLWGRDGMLVSELAAEMEIDSATVTPMVQRLEKLELVKRVRNTEDERRVSVFLTDKGKAYYNQALSIPESMGCATGVGPKQAETLIKQLKQIRDFMKTSEG